MNARAVEDAARRLRELHREEWEDVALAVLTLALAIAATQVRPTVALPLLAGGGAAAVLAVRAFWRRWDLLDRLTFERDAHTIPEVRAEALKAATPESRQRLAQTIHRIVRGPGLALAGRVTAYVDELEELATELERAELVLDPACAVECVRLLTDGSESPLFNPSLPPQDVRSRVRQIRSGFERQLVV
jgi:hypothetical protein